MSDVFVVLLAKSAVWKLRLIVSILTTAGAVYAVTPIHAADDGSIKLADARSDAQTKCVRELGPGGTADEELDFGEVNYVCDCVSPYQWNGSNTRCVKQGASQTTIPSDDTARSGSDSTTNKPLDTGAMVRRWRSVEVLNSEAAYRDFILEYPDSTYADTARRKLEKILTNSAALFNKGIFAHNISNYATAKREFLKAIEYGSTDAMVMLGYMFHDGQGGPRNYSEAERYYEMALENGKARSGYALALMYDQGKGVRHSRYPKLAAARFMVAALKGHHHKAFQEMTTNANAWSKQFRRELQKIMRDEGVYNGAIDGSFGPGTKRALKLLAGRS